VLRPATPADHGWIRALSGEVYRSLGDYATIIGSWLDHPGVLIEVDVTATGEPRGFLLIGFVDGYADLLAIAVAVAHQGRGLGGGLLAHAVALAHQRGAAELRLTVADSNPRAQALFRRSGFAVLAEDHGRYDGGQRAIRMRRSLP
jgi:ribosomal-protein-alanine N-acetyltransferase